MESLQAESLLRCLPYPTLIVSSAGTVLAANRGISTLTGIPAITQQYSSIVGQHVAQLEVTFLPMESPAYRDWDSVFTAASTHFNSDVHRCTALHHSSSSNAEGLDELDQTTTKTWDAIRRDSNARVDVSIRRRMGSRDCCSRGSYVRAQMDVGATVVTSGLMFVVSFEPPSSIRCQSLLVKAEQPHVLPVPSFSGFDGISHPHGPDPKVHSMISALIPHIMALIDVDGLVQYLSESWYDFTGLTEAQSLRSGWAVAVHPDDVAEMIVAWSNALKAHEQFTWQARYRRQDGNFCWFLIRAQPYKDEDGKVTQWYASMLDVNQFVLARLESEHRRQTIELLLSQSDVSMWGINEDHELYIREGTLDWDPTKTAPSSIDYTSCDEDVNQIITDIFDGKTHPSTLEHQNGDRFYRTRFVTDTEYHKPGKDKTRSLAVLGLTIDITDVKARRLLEMDNKQLVSSERAALEASEIKSRFLANISHEIRTPIAGVVGMNNLLADSGLDEEQARLSQGIRQSAAFLLALVNDVLDFSKIEAGHMDIETVKFRPSTLMRDIHQLMAFQAARKGLTIDYHNGLPEETVVMGDPQRLQQILMNLLGNSIKFTDKGVITLTMRSAMKSCFLNKTKCHADGTNDTRVQRPPPVPLSNSGTMMLEFVVHDEGCGIDDQTMQKLFRPFNQADSSTARKHGGTGLGLTISKQLAELMGGSIELKSTPNVGSIATVRIPYAHYSKSRNSSGTTSVKINRSVVNIREVVTPPATELFARQEKFTVRESQVEIRLEGTPRQMSFDGTLSSSERAQTSVLVVEDNSVNQKIAIMLVQKLGFKVDAVSNGEEALTYLSSLQKHAKPVPGVILMDCMMPIMDGYEASRRLRAGTDRFPSEIRKIPIIAVTASAIRGDKEKCQEAGMDDYLSKPIVKADLEYMLVRWTLQGRK